MLGLHQLTLLIEQLYMRVYVCCNCVCCVCQGVVTLLCAVVTALTLYTREGVESLCCLPGQGQNVRVVKWLMNEMQRSQAVKQQNDGQIIN